MNDWTFVTAFYHLPKYGGQLQTGGYSPDKYFEWGEFVLNLDVNLVIYCDEEYYDKFQTLRCNLSTKTKVIKYSLNELLFYSYRGKIESNRQTIMSCADPRNSVNYFILTCSKFLLVEKTIQNNYFPSEDSYYAWIDFGLGKNGTQQTSWIDEIISTKRQKVSFCYIDYTPINIMNNYQEYYKFGRCGTAGGFFTGARKYLLKVCELLKQQFIDTVEAGYGHAEEQLIPVVYNKHQDLFEFYFGDYNFLLSNYKYTRNHTSQIIQRLCTKSRMDSNHDLCQQVCTNIICE